MTKSDGDTQVSKVHNFCESGQESEDLSEPILFNEFIDIKIRYGIDLYTNNDTTEVADLAEGEERVSSRSLKTREVLAF